MTKRPRPPGGLFFQEVKYGYRYRGKVLKIVKKRHDIFISKSMYDYALVCELIFCEIKKEEAKDEEKD